MITKIIAIDVIKPVIVVELFAKSGIFIRLLLIRMKKSLERKANPAPTIKCQSRSSLIIPRGDRFEPLMNDREPVSRTDMTVTTENNTVYIATCNIRFVFLVY
jgi:hypothetical protein